MSFLRKLFGRDQLDPMDLATSSDLADYAQIDLLSRFDPARPLDDERTRRQWEKVLPRSYEQQISLFTKQGWLTLEGDSARLTETARPAVDAYRRRLAQKKQEAMAAVRRALQEKDTSEALAIRRRYDAAHPLGKADWTGPEPQLSHSALTRRILFLEHWLLEDLTPETAAWLRFYAAEQHLWGAQWRLPAAEIPASVAQELSSPEMDASEAAYWRANGLILLVENQETWQRCKGGDHVRRIEIQGPDDEHTCDHCRSHRGQQFLVARTPELPHRACSSSRGCRCVYVPVLD